MNIAIDYDDTYTADPVLWDCFIPVAMLQGHTVFIVTCRVDDSHNRECVRVPGIPAHRHNFTGHAAKRWFMEQKGIHIDVWIDDRPETIERGM